MRILIAVGLLLATGLSGWSQDFRSGFVVQLSGDTLRGYVEYTSISQQENQCSFKTELNGTSTYYKPGEIKAYGSSRHRLFVSKVSPGSSSPAFMQQLETGRITLYAHRGTLYAEKDSLIQLPQPQRTVVETKDGIFSKEDNRFVGFLSILIADCPANLGHLKYEPKAVGKVVAAYNLCTGTSPQPNVEQPPWSRINTQVFTGLLFSQLSPSLFPMQAQSTDASPFVGAAIEFSSPRINDKIFFVVELWYYPSFFQGYSELTQPTYTDRLDYTLKSSNIKIPLGVRFNFRTEKSTCYVKLGWLLNYSLNPNASVTLEREQSGVVTTNYTSYSSETSQQSGYWAGFGYVRTLHARLKGFAEVRGELISNQLTSGSNTTNVVLMVGLRF